MAGDGLRAWRRAGLLFAVKSVYALAFFVIQSAILYLLYSGSRGRTDRRAAAALAIATAESVVYAGNGFRCPAHPGGGGSGE